MRASRSEGVPAMQGQDKQHRLSRNHLRRIASGSLVVGALFGSALVFSVRPGTAFQFWSQSASVSVECDANGDLFGAITGVPGPYPRAFDVFVTDHIPGKAFFVEIPGSRVGVMAFSDTVNYGPLDTSQHRAGINTMRVETTLEDNAKSRSLLCGSASTTTPVATTPATTSTSVASTPTVGISTSTPVPPTSTPATGTPAAATVTPGSTSAATSTVGASGSPSSEPTLVNTVLGRGPPIQMRLRVSSLPSTGQGPGDNQSNPVALVVAMLGGIGALAGAWAIRHACSAR